MKKYGSLIRAIHPWSGLAERVGYAISIFTGVIIGVDKDAAWLSDHPVVLQGMRFVERQALFIYSISLALIIISFFIKKYGKPWVWDKIKFILDEYQGKAFFVDVTDPQDHHRVTLFKCKRSCIFTKHWSSRNWWRPWGSTPVISNYLVPVLRSGHLSQKSSAAFHAPDNSDLAEGVAGWAWAARNSIVIPELPDVNDKKIKMYQKKQYAEGTNSKLEMVEYYISKDRHLPRSIAAIPVDVHSKPWGVVVLDSRSVNGVQEDSVLNYSLTVALLGQLLEEA